MRKTTGMQDAGDKSPTASAKRAQRSILKTNPLSYPARSVFLMVEREDLLFN